MAGGRGHAARPRARRDISRPAARSVILRISGMASEARLLHGARRQSRRLRGGHQEGLSQARDEASSGPQSGRQGLRGEIQGGQGGLRGPHRREEARGLRPVRSRGRRSFGRVRAAARAFGGGGPKASADSPTRSATSSARSSARSAADAATASIAAPTFATTSSSRLRKCGARHRGEDPHSGAGGVRDVPRQRRQARHAAQALPDLPRPRRSPRVAGLLLDPADVPDVSRHRQDHPRPLRHLPRRRSHQEAQDAVGQDSRRASTRTTASGCRARAKRASTAGRRATSTSSSTSSRTRCSSATAATCIARCRSASPLRRSAARSRSRRSTATPTIKIPPETQTGQVFRLRSKGIKPVRGVAARRSVSATSPSRRRSSSPRGRRNSCASSRRSTRRTRARTTRGRSRCSTRCGLLRALIRRRGATRAGPIHEPRDLRRRRHRRRRGRHDVRGAGGAARPPRAADRALSRCSARRSASPAAAAATSPTSTPARRITFRANPRFLPLGARALHAARLHRAGRAPRHRLSREEARAALLRRLRARTSSRCWDGMRPRARVEWRMPCAVDAVARDGGGFALATADGRRARDVAGDRDRRPVGAEDRRDAVRLPDRRAVRARDRPAAARARAARVRTRRARALRRSRRRLGRRRGRLRRRAASARTCSSRIAGFRARRSCRSRRTGTAGRRCPIDLLPGHRCRGLAVSASAQSTALLPSVLARAPAEALRAGSGARRTRLRCRCGSSATGALREAATRCRPGACCRRARSATRRPR